MLNLVSKALEAVGMQYVRLDGSTPAKARADIVKEFACREPGSPVVFLVRGQCRSGQEWDTGDMWGMEGGVMQKRGKREGISE